MNFFAKSFFELFYQGVLEELTLHSQHEDLLVHQVVGFFKTVFAIVYYDRLVDFVAEVQRSCIK